MAQKKRPQRRWLGRALFYIFFPLTIWALAFLLWFFWPDLRKLAGYDDPKGRVPQKPKSGEIMPRPLPQPAGSPQEKILDEDREKLEDILKRR